MRDDSQQEEAGSPIHHSMLRKTEGNLRHLSAADSLNIEQSYPHPGFASGGFGGNINASAKSPLHSTNRDSTATA